MQALVLYGSPSLANCEPRRWKSCGRSTCARRREAATMPGTARFAAGCHSLLVQARFTARLRSGFFSSGTAKVTAFQQQEEAVALIACKECSGRVSDTASTCPHCGAPVSVPALSEKTLTISSDVETKKSGSVWAWVFGVPIGLFILMMAIGMLNPAPPEQARARDIYKQCLRELEAQDRARSSGATPLAGMCEQLRSEYVKKWGSTP